MTDTLPDDIDDGDVGHNGDHEEIHLLLGQLEGQTDYIATGVRQGLASARPAAGASNLGLLDRATDEPSLAYSDGSDWLPLAVPAEDTFFGSGRPWVDVMSQELADPAVGDFSHDDTPAFEEAPTLLPPTGGIVYLPPPPTAYMVSGDQGANIDNQDNVEIRGAGWSSLIKRSGDATAAERRIFTVDTVPGFAMRDLAIDLNGSERFGGVNINACDGTRLTNVHVYDSNLNASWATRDHYAFVVQNSNGVWQQHCWVENAELIEANLCENVHVNFNLSEAAAGTTALGGFSVSDGYTFYDYDISHNVFKNPRKTAILFQNEAGGTDNAIFRRITIAWNKVIYDDAAIASASQHAIALGNFTGVAASGNIFEAVHIEHNTIWSSSAITRTSAAIRLLHNQGGFSIFDGCHVDDNDVTGTFSAGTLGIQVGFASNGSVSRNSVISSGGAGYNVSSIEGMSVKDNFYDGTGAAYAFSVQGTHNSFANNEVGVSTPSSYATVTNADSTNHMVGCGPTRTFTDADTTPSVGGGDTFIASNSGATAITDFDDGMEGQVLTILFTNGNTTVNDNVNITLNGNFTGTADDMLTLKRISNKWREIGRVAA